MKNLIGSEKQIAWAEKIRAGMVENLSDEEKFIGMDFSSFTLESIFGEAVCRDRLRAASAAAKSAGGDIECRRDAKRSELRRMAAEALEIIENESSAVWFIEHR